ncbi:MAG: hypothetical protein QM296_09105 [Bacillota bacterium]|nr:hypothetical protein [Bacillota bacterium]
MNLIEFLETVQTGSESFSRAELLSLVRMLALNTPEEERAIFLRIMREAEAGKESVQLPELATGIQSQVAVRVRAVLPKLEEIAAGERCLDSEADWEQMGYSDDEMIYAFRDEDDVLRDINEALALVPECIDCGLHDLGTQLTEKLMKMEVQVTGDHEDYEDGLMDLLNLDLHNLLGTSYVDFCTEALYLAYVGNELSQRPAAVYDMLRNIDGYLPTPEEVSWLGGGVLPDFAQFLPLWLGYLASLDEKLAQRQLGVALELEKDLDFLSRQTRDHGMLHPRHYPELLEKLESAADWEKMLVFGREAMENLPPDYLIRSEIALKVAGAAVKLGQFDQAEEFWFEAFRSDSSLVNYLRLRFACRDWTTYADRVRAAYESVWKTKKGLWQGYYGEDDGVSIRKNFVSDDMYLNLLLLDGRLGEILASGEEDAPFSLPHVDVVDRLTPLSLLLFCQDSDTGPGLTEVLDNFIDNTDFTATAYNVALPEPLRGTDEKVLWSLILKWRAVAGIMETEKEKWLEKVEAAICSTVDSILRNQNRKRYDWAADLLAALGEVRESEGHKGRKLELLRHFRQKYPRLSGFKREVSRYGMRE